MKRDKSAQSKIITTVLIILLVLVSIVIVWNIFKKTVVRGTEGIGTSKLTIDLEIQNVKLWVTGGAQVKVKRNAGIGEIESLKFIFEETNGENKIIEIKKDDPNCEIPNELETKICNFNSSQINSKIERISIVPDFGSSTGIQIYENEKTIEKDNSGERIPEENLTLEIINDLRLVSWWKFDGNANDSIRENHGTPTGDAFVNINGELVLDGNNDNIAINDDLILNITKTGTWTAWIYLNEGSTYYEIISKTEDTGGLNNPYDFRVGNGSDFPLFFVRANSTIHKYCKSEDMIEFGIWHFVAITIDIENNCTFYINGQASGKSVLNVIPTGNTKSVLIGGRDDGLSFNGSIDNVMIFNKSLSYSEIQAIYNNQKK